MRLFTVTSSVLSLAVSCLGSYSLVKHESRAFLPAKWEQSHRAPANTELPLRIALAQPNLDHIGDFLLDVSHPDSANYGNHWSAAKVAEIFRPSDQAVQDIREWLSTQRIDDSRVRLSKSAGWIEAQVSVAEAEQLLKAEYHVYNHTETGTKFIGCASGYHIPEHLVQHIDFITPTVHFNVVPLGTVPQRGSTETGSILVPRRSTSDVKVCVEIYLTRISLIFVTRTVPLT